MAADLIPEGFNTGLGDANWKTRLATLDEMTGWVDGAVEQLDAEVVVRFLAKKGWNEKNFQVRVDDARYAQAGTTLIYILRFRSSCTAYLASSRNALRHLEDRRLRYASHISAKSWET